MLCILALSACEAGPIELSVDVRTNLVAERDFDRVWIEVTPAQGSAFAPVESAADADAPWREGVRIADFVGVPRGEVRVRVSLLDPSAAEVIGRTVEIPITSSYGLTIFLSADCVGHTCPGESEPSTSSECLSGACVEPGCAGPSPRGCGAIACAADGDCEDVLDCPAICFDGACVCSSARDGGAPCECGAGDVDTQTQECALCGVETRTRPCGEDGCTWGEWTAWGECESSGECVPDTVRPGCDECGEQVCQSNCRWGECQPVNRAANGCLRVRPGSGGDPGSNFWCCSPGHWAFCLPAPDCRWSNSCAACSESMCGECY
jgi:hypothetical protein